MEVDLGLKWLFDAEGERLVVAPTGDQLRYGPLAEALNHWPPVRTATTRTLSQASVGHARVLAAWADTKMLEKIESRWPSAICVIPWNFEEIDSWVRGRQAVDLMTPSDQLPKPTISDPVVAEAMKSLTASVNLGTSLLHPSDKRNAVETFQLLRGGGHGWDPAEIERWALANGWEMDGASAVRKVAEGVLRGKRFRIRGTFPIRESALEYWRQQASKESPDAPA